MTRLQHKASPGASTPPRYRSRYFVRLDDPVPGLLKLAIVEQPEFARHGEAEHAGHRTQPTDIGHDADPLPSGDMPEAELQVVPHGAGVKAGEIFAQVKHQAQLRIQRERRFDIRYQYRLVIVGGDLAVRSKSEHASRQVGHLHNHGGLLRQLSHSTTLN